MSSTLTLPQVGFSIQGTLTDTSRSGAKVVAMINDSTATIYSVGTNLGQVAFEYSANLSIGTGGTTLDLTSLTDPDGNAIVFTKVMGLKLTNLHTNTSNVTIGGGSNPIFATDPIPATGGTASAGVAMNNWRGFKNDNGLVVAGGSTNNLKLISDTAATPVSLTLFGH